MYALVNTFIRVAKFESRFPVRVFESARFYSGVCAGVALLVSLGLRVNALLGLGLILFGAYALFHFFTLFLTFYKNIRPKVISTDTKDEELLKEDSIFEYFDFEATQIMLASHYSPDPDMLIHSAAGFPFFSYFLMRLGMTPAMFKKEFAEIKSSRERFGAGQGVKALGVFLADVLSVAKRNGHSQIHPSDLLGACATASQAFKLFLLDRNIDEKDIDRVHHWQKVLEAHKRKGFLQRLGESAGIGKDWAYAYTVKLDAVSTALGGARARDSLHVLAHQKQILVLEGILAKTAGANALLVGDPGIGKMTVIEGLAVRIRNGLSARELNYDRVRKLSMELVFSGKSYSDMVRMLTDVLQDAERAGSVVLVIDEIHNYLSKSSPTNVAEVLLPFLKSSRVKIVGLTTLGGYEKEIVENPLVASLFEKIRIEEPDHEEMMLILEDAASHEEVGHGVFILYAAIKKIYELSRLYITDVPFPEKGIELLQQVVTAAVTNKTPLVTDTLAAEVMSRRVNMPLGVLDTKEKEKLLTLEGELHKRVIGQYEAIKKISEAMRRSRSGVAAENRPAGSFLFLGPTGVGKTETAKALAAVYFGNEERMIRFDMSEYQNQTDIGRLIGNQATGEVGVMAKALRDDPFSLVLLDEIEKAHPDILNLFLQVLDEGKFTDAFGRPINFKNAIIIATSNAGAEFIRQQIQAGQAYDALSKGLVDFILQKAIFRPEFVNRFDGVVVYRPLVKEEIREIAKILLQKLGERLEKKGFTLEVPDDVIAWLAEAGYNEVFGARELRRIVQEKVESKIATDILSDVYKRGDMIRLQKEDL